MRAMPEPVFTLEEHRIAFSRRRGLAMPLSGCIAWSAVGIGSLFLDAFQASMLLFLAIGSIFYLAVPISKLTGEDMLRRGFGNPFDGLFFAGLLQALLVFAIAIPFFMKDYRSITLTVGILTGLMWIPFSWIVQHWIGYFHAVARTALIVAAWYLWPELHFQLIPLIIVALYLVTIAVLEKRWHAMKR